MKNTLDNSTSYKKIQEDVEEFHSHELFEFVESKRFAERTVHGVYSELAGKGKISSQMYSDLAKMSKKIRTLKHFDNILDKRFRKDRYTVLEEAKGN
jgi:hypothetical protein